ncbi:hypothetical protein BDA99DRAFT_554075 [Phascolomyces articulosus]|uniref:Uncharacterized protein n=1 Tax=Phascolomyces articulosus TaxID=60185 RepID=A0AAD5KC07_9FUNG|nr:hypothetical protein BDA99DRAFT_554075 [Phascolomyces articulosus]
MQNNLFLCNINEHECDPINKDISINIVQQQISERGTMLGNDEVIFRNNTSTNHHYSSTEKIISSSNDQSLIQQSSSTNTKKGLCRFVIINEPLYLHLNHIWMQRVDPYDQWSNRSIWDNCFSMINERNQDSIELVYIKNDIIAMRSLNTWYNSGHIASNLRELHLYDGGFYGSEIRGKVAGPFNDKISNNILIKLLPCLPVLEAISIFEATSYCSYDRQRWGLDHPFSFHSKMGSLYVDDVVLKKLAKHCHQIHCIKVNGYYSRLYTSKGVFSLAEDINPAVDSNDLILLSRKLPITYLDMYIPPNIILPLVKRMNSLKELNLRGKIWGSIIVQDDVISPEDYREVKTILNDRGGSLNIFLRWES